MGKRPRFMVVKRGRRNGSRVGRRGRRERKEKREKRGEGRFTMPMLSSNCNPSRANPGIAARGRGDARYEFAVVLKTAARHSAPGGAHAAEQVDRGRRRRHMRRALGRRRPGLLLEALGIGRRDEARAAGVQMAVAARRLLRDVEALRHQQVQVIAWRASSPRRAGAAPPRSRCAPVRHVGRDAAVDHVEHVHRASTPAPWPSGWSRGSGSPRRAAAGPARSLVASGGSSVSSVRKRSREA